jgi:hypothetical protein
MNGGMPGRIDDGSANAPVPEVPADRGLLRQRITPVSPYPVMRVFSIRLQLKSALLPAYPGRPYDMRTQCINEHWAPAQPTRRWVVFAGLDTSQ